LNRIKKNITIENVARQAGVSKATVSAVLNNKSSVATSTREHVLEIIRKLNYRPNHIARSLSIRRTRTIGLVVKQIDNPYFTKVTRSVLVYFNERGYTVLLGSSELSPEKEKESVETLLRQRVDGLILSPLQERGTDLSYLSRLIQDRLPLVLLDKVPNIPASVVDIQNSNAAWEAVNYLLQLGHTRIAYYEGPDYSLHNTERLHGFQQAMLKKGLKLGPSSVRKAGVYIEDGYRTAVQQFSESGEKPTAIFCFNDLVAIGVMNALSDLNINVPDDVSIIGFDDIEFCSAVKVPLSSVSVPAFDIGMTAAGLLLKFIENRARNLKEVIELKAPLVLRASCARLKTLT
jgi:LacI family transcriptional regulator/LacI family repressor for deo operon, udp, cdd, tsx, nupC, and nupG